MPSGRFRPWPLERPIESLESHAHLPADNILFVVVSWVSGSDVRRQIQFINKLFEVVA